ncbi:MAG: hypothetical protein LLG06_03380 [Desulfobacteraceae bacterium]|nr:hypothetical protein [Desulfobacteraceae bacterium]
MRGPLPMNTWIISPNVSQTNGVANPAPPAASWRIFVSIDVEHAGFFSVYLTRRGSAHGPKFLLVWHVGEARWVASGGLERARRKAGDEVIDWAADLVRRHLADQAFRINRIDRRDDGRKGRRGYEEQTP